MLPLLAAVLVTSVPGYADAVGGVRFEENRARRPPDRYVARARGQQVFLSDREIILSPPNGSRHADVVRGRRPARWEPVGASQETSLLSREGPGQVGEGRSDVRARGWRGVSGIDVVSTGWGIAWIRLVLGRGRPITGALRLREAASATRAEIYRRPPRAARQSGGRIRSRRRRSLPAEAGTVRAIQALVVDPVIEAATYIGGERDDEIVAVGEPFVAGNTRSLAFPADSGLRCQPRRVPARHRGTGPGYTSGKAPTELR